jgi:serine/threonine-protein kinase
VKLIDMGLARLRESDQAADLTASGVTLGTFDYISPEQARDPRCADVRSDVYSLGCTLFYMLTGQPPFPGGTVLQKLLQHQGDQPPDVKTFRPDLPDGLTHVLRKMLAKDPRHRYRVPADLVDDLLLLAKEVGAVPLALGGRSWIPPREPARSVVWQHLPWILPLVALVAIVFALDFYWSRTPQDGTPPFPERPVSGLSQQNAGSHISTDNGAKPPAAKTVAKPTLPPGPANPAKPPEEATAVKPPAKRVGVLVVGSPAEGESSFSTLGAACRAAVDGDVVELRYDGPRVEQPVKLENLRLTVRAADGFRPVVLFQPGKEERNMWTLTGGRLTMINVVIEMQIPRDGPSNARSLFEGRASPALRLERCSLTIRNVTDPLHTDVAFVRVKPALADEPLLGYRTLAEPASLELVNSVVRGEAVLLRVEDSQPARLAWDNGLLVTSEWLLSATGATTGSRNGGVEPLRIDLRHVTAIMRRGLCRLTSDVATPRHLAAQINCTDSILVGGGGSVLLEQVGDEGPNELRQQIAWNGDRNMYDSFDAFWVLRRSDRETPPVLMGFEVWKSHWGPRENLPQCEKVEWQRAPAAILPLHRRTPADYTLSATDGNPALGTASDGRNLGCQADRLPGLFQEAASENPLPKMLDPEPFELDPSPGGKAGKPVPDSSAIRRPKRLSG